MENPDLFNNATAPLTFHNFYRRMRDSSATDIVKSIKIFIGAFLNCPPDPEKDSQSVQDFYVSTENAFRAHPLWAGATDEDFESSGEGLEKYLMTKLFPKAFAPIPAETAIDQELSERMTILQEFIRPEHLDIRKNSQNETSWLLAQKELQRMNSYKNPRDKLVCILNCCRVISNLLVNASMASHDAPPGADDFLPVLIYVVIKANPPQLHSNLQYIQRYRHQGRLVSEAAYFFTNLVSAESFIRNLNSTSLSMDSVEFEKRMRAGKVALEESNVGNAPQISSPEVPSSRITSSPPKALSPAENERSRSTSKVEGTRTTESSVLMADNLEARAAAQVLEADKSGQLRKDYPFLYSSAGDLRVMDVEALLYEYKELVLRYVALRKGLEDFTLVERPTTSEVKQDSSSHDSSEDGRGERSVTPDTLQLTEETQRTPEVDAPRGEISDLQHVNVKTADESGLYRTLADVDFEHVSHDDSEAPVVPETSDLATMDAGIQHTDDDKLEHDHEGQDDSHNNRAPSSQ